MTNFDSTSFDAANSTEILATALRDIKKRIVDRYETAQKKANPHKQPSEKEIKAAKEAADVEKVYKQLVSFWQEEAFKMGYLQALSDVNADIKQKGV